MPDLMSLSGGRVPAKWRGLGWTLKMGNKMFQNLIQLTKCHAKTSNGAVSTRKFPLARTAESHVEIEASQITGPQSSYRDHTTARRRCSSRQSPPQPGGRAPARSIWTESYRPDCVDSWASSGLQVSFLDAPQETGFGRVTFENAAQLLLKRGIPVGACGHVPQIHQE